MTVLSGIAHFSISEIEALKNAIINFDFSTLSDLDYDPDYQELNLFNPEDRMSLLRKIYKQNSFRFTQQEWHLALCAIREDNNVTLSFVYDMLWQLNNSFFFVD